MSDKPTKKIVQSSLFGMALPTIKGVKLKASSPLTVKQRARMMVAEMKKLGASKEQIKRALKAYGLDPSFWDAVKDTPAAKPSVAADKIVQNNLCQEVAPPSRGLDYDGDTLNFGFFAYMPAAAKSVSMTRQEVIVKDADPSDQPPTINPTEIIVKPDQPYKKAD